MKTIPFAKAPSLRLTAIGAALLAAFGPAQGQEDEEVARLAKPSSTASLGLGYVSSDNLRFGQYTGLRQEGLYGLGEVNAMQRNDATGTWNVLTGRNFGLDSRELRYEYQRQGDWRSFIDYSETPRYSQYLVNTRLSGIGTANVAINGEPAFRDEQLSTKRKAVTFGADKLLGGGFDVQVRFRNDQKDGARLFGRGTPGAVEFLAEPIDHTMRQFEARVGYTAERLQLSGGYYGSWFSNQNPRLDVAGGSAALAGGAIPFTPIALPPDNQAHQLFLSGGYNFSPTARGNFRIAYGRALQDEGFIVPPTVAIGRTDLGGRIDITQVQVGLTTRPLPKLTVLANARYEDRHDQTPVAQYFTFAGQTPAQIAAATTNGQNEPRTITTAFGKLEAAYLLPMGFRAIGGLDYDFRRRTTSPVYIVSSREHTEEVTTRFELVRSLSETLNGRIAYAHGNRTGSAYLANLLNGGALGSNLVGPLLMADRTRDKLRLLLDWLPLDPLSVQLAVDNSWDHYTGRNLGPRSGSAQSYSLDAVYSVSDAWKVTGWLARLDTRADQTTQVTAPTGQIWAAALRNLGDSYGIGVRGKPRNLVEVGADLSQSFDRGNFRLANITGPAIASLPDTFFRHTTLKLFARYDVWKNAGVRLDFVHDRWRIDDWTWVNWVYSDGTRVTQSPDQKVNFVGLSGYFQWR